MPDGRRRSRWATEINARLSSLRLAPARQEEIVEELSQHLDERYDELRASGISDPEARQLAVDELLEPDTLASFMRPLRQAQAPAPIVTGTPRRRLLGDLGQDVRYAVRVLAAQPLFGIAAVLTLALGIGANSAIFALVDATVLRPLPFPNPDRLVMVWQRTPAVTRGPVAAGDIQDWNARGRSFESVAGFVPNVGGMVWNGGGGLPETIPRQWVSAEVFNVLGVTPLVGRTFQTSDAIAHANVVVLSEGFWRTRFNADPAVVGTTLSLDRDPFTIVGVMPKQAEVIGRASIWALAWNRFPADRAGTRSPYVQAIGRLKPGVSFDAAAADVAKVSADLAREFPATNEGRTATLEPMNDAVIGRDLRQTSVLFLAVVGIVLLICCANVGNLLLTRAMGRRRELAMRAALGADRFRIVRQLLTESLLLALIGGALGTVAGAWILRVAPSIIPPDVLPAALTITFNARVVLFSAGAVLAVGVLFGLAPAWQGSTLSPAREIAFDDRTMTARGGRVRAALVVGQVATAVALLFGAGLLVRSLLNLDGIDRGYQADDVLTMIVDPPFGGADALLRFYDAVEREAIARPGIHSVGWGTTLPLGRSYRGRTPFEVVGEPLPEESQRPSADYQIASPSYFQTLVLPIVDGRSFDVRDTRTSVPVCLVNEAIVRRHFAGRSPIGRRLSLRTAGPDEPPVVREVIGVARQVKGRSDETEDLLQIYVPLAQETAGDIFIFARPKAGPASALVPDVRAAIAEIDRENVVSVRSPITLEDVARDGTARYRFRAVLVMAFAGVALLLAMVGLFGVLAYSVEQRVREFGVRRALGATTADVLRLVLQSAVKVLATGVIAGLVISLAVGRLVATMLFGVEPIDVATLASVVGVLVLTGAAAAAAPAWRVTRIDPATALRAK